jgi:hypothetical protein
LNERAEGVSECGYGRVDGTMIIGKVLNEFDEFGCESDNFVTDFEASVSRYGRKRDEEDVSMVWVIKKWGNPGYQSYFRIPIFSLSERKNNW